MKDPIVSCSWLHKNLDNPELIILDASQKDHNIQIKRARFFDLKNTFSDQGSMLPNMLPSALVFQKECRNLGISAQSKIVVYDNLGIYTSPRVWWMFKTMGHKQVSILDGGLPAWLKEGHETEPFQERHFERGNFEAKYHPELVKNLDDVANNLSTKDALVIDARSEERFKGMAPEPREGLSSGHIPHSINLPFKKVLHDGKYKPKEELSKIFGDMNLGDSPLIFSCGSGITACIIMLAAEMATENDKSVYDGSWTEWGQSENMPIEREGPP